MFRNALENIDLFFENKLDQINYHLENEEFKSLYGFSNPWKNQDFYEDVCADESFSF